MKMITTNKLKISILQNTSYVFSQSASALVLQKYQFFVFL